LFGSGKGVVTVVFPVFARLGGRRSGGGGTTIGAVCFEHRPVETGQ
jgi:hypothetical protein